MKTTHIWDGSNIALELNNSNAVSARYIRGINLIKTAANVYFLYNAHGDVVQLTNSSGTVTKNYRYDAFGVEMNKADNDTNPWRYSKLPNKPYKNKTLSVEYNNTLKRLKMQGFLHTSKRPCEITYRIAFFVLSIT